MEYENLPRLRIVLDLDETLIHAYQFLANNSQLCMIDEYGLKHGTIQVVIFNEYTNKLDTETFQIIERPYLQEFLYTISKIADIYVFTSGVKEYAHAIANYLDASGTMFKAIYSKDDLCDWCFAKKHLQFVMGNEYIPERTIFIDDKPLNHAIQIENGILIPIFSYEEHPYFSEERRISAKNDIELVKISSFIVDKLLFEKDVRPIIQQTKNNDDLKKQLELFEKNWEVKRENYLAEFVIYQDEWKLQKERNHTYSEKLQKEAILCSSNV